MVIFDFRSVNFRGSKRSFHVQTYEIRAGRGLPWVQMRPERRLLHASTEFRSHLSSFRVVEVLLTHQLKEAGLLQEEAEDGRQEVRELLVVGLQLGPLQDLAAGHQQGSNYAASHGVAASS